MTFQKFNAFVATLGASAMNLNTDALKIMLTNTAPVATNAILTDITEIAAGNGYVAGGAAVASSGYTQTAGTATLIGNAVTWTATGSIGPLRYAVIYDSTLTTPLHPLIGFWDNGSSITLTSGQSFTVAATSGGANWTAATPILSIA